MTQENKVIIKISGERNAVLNTIKKVESLFPLFLEGKVNPNDDGKGVHAFITVAVGGT